LRARTAVTQRFTSSTRRNQSFDVTKRILGGL